MSSTLSQGVHTLRILKRYATLVALAACSSSCFAGAVEKPPVILISIDTLRADHLSAYGYTRIRTPNIDAIGDGGTTYERIESQIPFTLPSHTVLMTSAYPFENQVESNDVRVPTGTVTLASVLRANGYRTAAFVGSMILRRDAGLDQGFEVYDTPPGTPAGQQPDMYFTGLRRDAALVTTAAQDWMDRNRAAPLFAFIHLYDLHTPYTPPTAPGLEPATAGYDLELAHVDEVLGQLQKTLRADGLWDRALVVLLADHGESLGDHGEAGHGYFIYDSTVHVPLIIHWPAAGPSARRSREPGGLIDVAPTILDFLHISAPPSFRGVSLLAQHERTAYGESPFAKGAGGVPLRSLVAGQYKYIDASEAELYDLLKDPGELVNVLAAHPEEALSMRARIDALTAPYAHAPRWNTGADVSASTREMLRSLGYTARGPQAPKNDAREKLREAEALETATTLLSTKQYGRAAILLSQILTWNSQNVQARRALIEACRFVPTLPDCKGR
jgi:choline-sulfatase